MRAISLWQPWASAMALGLKRIETRHWSTSYRGPLAIHAAKRWTGEERDFAEACARHYVLPELAAPPLGAIVAVGFLTGVQRVEAIRDSLTPMEDGFGNYSNGRFGWLFRDIEPLPEAVPFKGAQGFFTVPDDFTPNCPACSGDCAGANPPVIACPMQPDLFAA